MRAALLTPRWLCKDNHIYYRVQCSLELNTCTLTLHIPIYCDIKEKEENGTNKCDIKEGEMAQINVISKRRKMAQIKLCSYPRRG